jgi:crotonobetainyl-CoA:carnitine CoA-transferase CaiB-like acyl-CoA transferase
LAVGSDKQFDELVKILGLGTQDLGDRFVKNQERVAHRKELNKILAEKIMSINSKVFIEKLRAKKIPAGFIQNLKEVFELPQAMEMLLSGAGVQGVRNYVGRDNGFLTLDAGLLPPPHLGEHTDEVVEAT